MERPTQHRCLVRSDRSNVSQELGGASRTGVTVRYDRSSALADAPAARFGEAS